MCRFVSPRPCSILFFLTPHGQSSIFKPWALETPVWFNQSYLVSHLSNPPSPPTPIPTHTLSSYNIGIHPWWNNSQLQEDSATAFAWLARWGWPNFTTGKAATLNTQADIEFIFSITLYFSVFFCLYNITIVLYHVTPFRYISCLYYVLH